MSRPTSAIVNGDLQLRLLNLAGAGPVLIEASSDLITWKPVFTSGRSLNAGVSGCGREKSFAALLSRDGRAAISIMPLQFVVRQ